MKFINMLVLGMMTFAGSLILLKGKLSNLIIKNSTEVESAEPTL